MDKRGQLLVSKEIDEWIELPNLTRIGIKHRGEFRMGLEAISLIIKKGDEELFNSGEYRYMTNSLWEKTYFFLDETSNYLVLNWIYRHVHNSIVPIVFDLNNQLFQLIFPEKILEIHNFRYKEEYFQISGLEQYWKENELNSRTVNLNLLVKLKSIEEYYWLDPMTIETNVYKWVDKELRIIPLKDYRGEPF